MGMKPREGIICTDCGDAPEGSEICQAYKGLPNDRDKSRDIFHCARCFGFPCVTTSVTIEELRPAIEELENAFSAAVKVVSGMDDEYDREIIRNYKP